VVAVDFARCISTNGYGQAGRGNRRRDSWRLRLQCAIFFEIVGENEGAHVAMTERNVQKIGKTIIKTTDHQSRNVRLFILP
jgi:hypothetical protein